MGLSNGGWVIRLGEHMDNDYDYDDIPDYETIELEKYKVNGYCWLDGHKTHCQYCFPEDRIKCENSLYYER